jgi:DNA-binding CsgD family transcriptional regulator
MARASHRQLEAFSKALLELHRDPSIETLGEDFLRVMGGLIRSDFCVVNWVERDAIPRILSDREYPVEARIEVFNEHVADHPTFPLVAKYAQTRDPLYMVGRWSDFTSVRQFRETGLHRDFFRPLETNFQIFVACPAAGGGTNIGVSFQRERRDFTDEEMLLLRLAGPHLEQAYLRALHRAEIEGALTERELALSGSAVMIATGPAGREALLHCTQEALRLCEQHFAGRTAEAAAREILRECRLRQATRITRCIGGSRLVVECLESTQRRKGDRAWLLRMAEKSTTTSPAQFAHLGLTPREAEVLAWISEGKTNEEIAMILGTRPNTVRKHVENIHRKLGVENRGAAAALAREFF